MKYDIVLFDLDGTLTDPALGITNSVIYALKHFDIEVADRTELYKFIGPPLMDSFAKFYGFDNEKCKEATAYYREHYREQGIFENMVYPGMEEMLQRLRSAGLRLAVATSKPEPFAKQIIEHFGLASFFDYVAGSTLAETRTNKAEVIEYALEVLGVTQRNKVLMVGDREYDVIGAEKCGLDSMGVLYGYGSKEELEAAGAKYIVEHVVDVADLILSL